MSKFGCFITAALVLAPTAVMATMPAHDGYMLFALTKAELAQMPNAADKACLATAAAKATNENGRIVCNNAIYKRLDARLNIAYRAAMTRLPKAKAATLRAEENAWLASRDKICAAGTAKYMNPQSVSYRALISDCGLAELYRRTMWLERYR
jgi:uncharacterized protein YecT (DUF1311 family)